MEGNHLSGAFYSLRRELCLRGPTPELKKLAEEILAADEIAGGDVSSTVLPEDLRTLSTNDWTANFSINDDDK